MAQSNKSLNISDLDEWRKENKVTISDPSSDDAAGVRTMLCMPIVNANKDVIGVAQLINKVREKGVLLRIFHSARNFSWTF